MMKLKNDQEGYFILMSPRAVRRYSTVADGWIFQYEQPSKLSDGIQSCVLIASMSTPIGDIVPISWYCGVDRWIRMVCT
jgi:hypothetical protein